MLMTKDRARYIPFNARFVDEPDPEKPNEKLADQVFAEETMTGQEERQLLLMARWRCG